MCKTNKHKMRIQYGMCTNAACLCTGIEEVNVVNDDVNVNIVSAKVVAITKAKLQAIAKVVDLVDDPVVEIVHEKRRGRPTLAEAALKLDKLQEIEKLKPVVVRRTSNRNSKKL